ncbi:MAG: cation-translocating P-type ATPase, partial [Gemmatimonadota bacterium]
MTDPSVTPIWHTRSAEEAVASLGANLEVGLTSGEVVRRLERFGPNRLREATRRSWVRMLAAQFGDVMVLVLLAAAVVAGSVGEPQDTIAIVAIVLLNALLGFMQEYRAERAVRALQALAAPLAHVRRDGAVATIDAAELVPGDVVLLEAGVIVPADLRLAAVHHMRVDESALTGESQGVDKDTRPISSPSAPLGDRRGMAFKGTVVTYGRGEGIVVATGMATELGRVATLLDEAEEIKTPLQRRLKRFATQLALVVIGLCAALFAIGLLRGEPPLLMFLTALSLAVAAMPEALPAVVTVSLALGARRMVGRNALIRRLPAVETLGSVTYICSDKTGTLTQNRMAVTEVRGTSGIPSPAAALADVSPVLLRAMALNSDATWNGDEAAGDPTEVALL